MSIYPPLAHIGLGLARLTSSVTVRRCLWKACRSVAQALEHKGNRHVTGPRSVPRRSHSLTKPREQPE